MKNNATTHQSSTEMDQSIDLVKEKQTIFLDPAGMDDLGLNLIIEAPTRIVYTHQTAGPICLEQSVEGYLIPLGARHMEAEICRFFQQSFSRDAYPKAIDWTPALIAELDQLVSKVNYWYTPDTGEDIEGFLKLDEDRIDQCVEAWIPVCSAYGAGYLATTNSDD